MLEVESTYICVKKIRSESKKFSEKYTVKSLYIEGVTPQIYIYCRHCTVLHISDLLDVDFCDMSC